MRAGHGPRVTSLTIGLGPNMLMSLRKKIVTIACVWLLLGVGAEVLAQGYRVQVYNPGVYNRTRQVMSNRAAFRAALKRKRERRRTTSRRNNRVPR